MNIPVLLVHNVYPEVYFARLTTEHAASSCGEAVIVSEEDGRVWGRGCLAPGWRIRFQSEAGRQAAKPQTLWWPFFEKPFPEENPRVADALARELTWLADAAGVEGAGERWADVVREVRARIEAIRDQGMWPYNLPEPEEEIENPA
jgi:hypothetical protein